MRLEAENKAHRAWGEGHRHRFLNWEVGMGILPIADLGFRIFDWEEQRDLISEFKFFSL